MVDIKWEYSPDNVVRRIYTPKTLLKPDLQFLHDAYTAGHMGIKKTIRKETVFLLHGRHASDSQTGSSKQS